MPDWSYHSIFKPMLFRMPAKLARDITLFTMGTLSRMPGGPLVIRTMGHMELTSILSGELAGVPIAYPVGLGGRLDPHGTAHRAMAQLGFGFIEVGPVTVQAIQRDEPILREVDDEAIVYPDGYENDGADRIAERMQRGSGHRLPHFFRLRPMPGRTPEQALHELRELLVKLAPYASGFYLDALDEGWPPEQAAAILLQAQQLAGEIALGKPVLLYVPLDASQAALEALAGSGALTRCQGVALGEAVRQEGGGSCVAADALGASLSAVRRLRALLAERQPLVACGGVHQPQDARELLAAGADCVQLHSGLVYAGPGLAKRVNEAVLYDRLCQLPEAKPYSFWANWGWMYLLGIGMLIGGVLAWLIAASSVLLPYDEVFLGVKRHTILEWNPRVLHFMSHDRITLAGTMMSIGIFYTQLARHGLREGLHWAKTAVFASCVVGFSSFFLYLGYGYFDPLHAAVAAVLLPMMLLTLRGLSDRPSRKPPGFLNDRIWLRAQWGQCCFVVMGVALAVGGLSISFIGITGVFVSTDLDYLGLSPQQLSAWNDRLIPLIAHDRAGFGGALFSLSIAITAAALWGVNKGEAWLWWTFLYGGLPGFTAGLWVHAHIGYTDFIHLLPVYVAIVLFAAGLILTFPYLMRGTGRGAE
ncbi:dihydroorotate dehydrogenase [Paenibacillus hexagrammi]|uniref:Dihydroorotate dehydrogenase catalytic domain-containing protein n=1 Tax=Paenibacillus hexagrammi TaxID=2908839 RepID=A0ABY3SI98_9BACL|nr:hypothetical protein [Paenibacillus sp. YPD9-1]UJF32964.1 hypothetical protein L0M14_25860 [Paenibacillus sp. YPD9-1]